MAEAASALYLIKPAVKVDIRTCIHISCHFNFFMLVSNVYRIVINEPE